MSGAVVAVRQALIAFATTALLAVPINGQAPKGYHVGARVVLPDSLVEVLAEGRFRASLVAATDGRIHRTYRTPPRDAGRRADRWWLNDVADVVELRLTWNYGCGMLCAMSLTHTRTVWFDTKGDVVRIEGDKHAEVSVS